MATNGPLAPSMIFRSRTTKQLSIVIEQKDKKGNVTRIDADEGVRADTTAEGLAKMKAAFSPDGTVTAGNASQISDGGAALVVMALVVAACGSGDDSADTTGAGTDAPTTAAPGTRRLTTPMHRRLVRFVGPLARS